MSDGFHVNSEDLLPAQTQPVAGKKRSLKEKIMFTLAGVLTLAIVGLAGFFAATNLIKPVFENNWLLSNNVPDNVNLTWDAPGDFKGDIENTPTGDWALNMKTGALTNPSFEGCEMLFTKLGGDDGTFGNDLEDTNRYTEQFFEGAEVSSKPTWVKVKNKAGETTGALQMQQTVYVDDAGNQALAYYRVMPENTGVLLGFIRCDSEETFNNLVDLEADTMLNNFSIWLNYTQN